MAETPATVRVDSWVWAVRLAPSRSAATTACKAGHVRVNGERAKASQPVRIGDEVRVRTATSERTVVARRLIVKRVGAAIAAECYDDRTPPPPPRVERPTTLVRDRGSGRPTKRDRRLLDRLMDRADRPQPPPGAQPPVIPHPFASNDESDV